MEIIRGNSVKLSISVNNSPHLFKKWGVSFIKKVPFLYDFVKHLCEKNMEYGRTAHNRSVYATGAKAPLWAFSPPHFARPQCCALLYRAGKTSYTAGTLGAIIFEIFVQNN
jgi:hypothetical protein